VVGRMRQSPTGLNPDERRRDRKAQGRAGNKS
jgi:hypothetical protein